MHNERKMPADLRMNDGNTIPQLGLGVWQVPPAETAKVVTAALAIGYRHIDTAHAYENEEGVGNAVTASSIPREEIFVTSKLRNKLQGYDEGMRAFDGSMERLGLETMDLYLVHWPWPKADRYVPSWKALIKLQESGRVRSIGVSNFNADHLERIIGETGITPVVNQIELHPFFQQKALRAVHDNLGILTESWSPLGQGKSFDQPVVQQIAAAHKKSPAQVILRWHLDCNLVTFPKSVQESRLRENFDVFDFQLSPEELKAMTSIDKEDGRIGPEPQEMDVAF